jgi:hypothetical protein
MIAIPFSESLGTVLVANSLQGAAPYLHIFEQDTRKSLFLKDLARFLPKNYS